MLEDNGCFLFTWKIRHFNFFDTIYCECINSPAFRVKDVGDSEWKICLFPRTLSEDIECRLERLTCKNRSINENIAVNFRYQVASCNGVVLKTSKVFSETFQEGTFSAAYRIKKLYTLIKELFKYPNDTLVFRCYMSMNSESMPLEFSDVTTGCDVETDVSGNNPWYIWTSKFINIDDWLVRKQIVCNNIPIEVTFKYVEDKICVELLSTVEDDWTHHFSCDIRLINRIGNEIVTGDGDYEFNRENQIWKFPNFISKQHLEDARCFIRKEIRLKFNISRFYSFVSKLNYYSKSLESAQNSDSSATDTTDISSSELQSDSPSDTDCLLYYTQHHLHNSTFSENNSNAKLRVENEVFHVHKSLLAQQSTVFSEMFTQDKNTSFFDVDLEVDAMKYFLEYLYTGTLSKMNVENALDLLDAAHRFQVVPLLNECSSFLENNLSFSNVCRVLYIADLTTYADLKSCCVNYIVENASEILSTSEWSYWIERNGHLATEILLKLSKKFSSKELLQSS